jgi:hypothetical protein
MLLTAMGGNQSNVIRKLDTTDMDDDVNSGSIRDAKYYVRYCSDIYQGSSQSCF